MSPCGSLPSLVSAPGRIGPDEPRVSPSRELPHHLGAVADQDGPLRRERQDRRLAQQVNGRLRLGDHPPEWAAKATPALDAQGTL